jgi:ribosome-associated toxin RatA of RatAB toxin-antitoxin module
VPFVAATIVIDAPRRAVYELAKEQERFPQFMPDVETVTVVERHADRVLTQWKTLIEDAPIEWLEEDRFDDAAARIDYRLIEGDLETFEGSWTFESVPGGTLVTLGVTYDFGVPTLAALIGPTLERKVRENAEMMLAAIKREAESAPIPASDTRHPSAASGRPHR